MMIICKTCSKKFKSIKSLVLHIGHANNNQNHPKDTQEYYDRYLKKDNEGICQNIKCPNGHPITSFQNITKGYSVGCCNSCSQLVSSVRKKIRDTCKEKYGHDHHLKNKSILKKRESDYITKTGKRNPMQIDEIKTRSVSTRMTRSDEIQKVREETNLLKFGVKNVMQNETVANKLSKLFIDRTKNEIISRLNQLDLEVLNYTKCSSQNLLKCKKCNHLFNAIPNHLFDERRYNYCSNCSIGYGATQNEVSDFCKQYYEDVECNNRKILDGKEIDVYIPEIKLGIEFNGLYWHGECKGKKDKNYHLNKTLLAKEKGIQLIHIFEDEWIEKQEIVKSILLAKMGKLTNRIFARKCEIKEINNNNIARDFLDNHHIQGYVRGTHIGLYYNNVLVSMASFGKNRYSNGGYELLRFCNHCYLTVVGGMSKLIKYFIRHNYINKLITYADLRFGIGHSYNTCGFVKTHISPPGYFYTDSFSRESRIKYQKHKLSNKLKIFDSNLTEWENMQLNGYDRIWDCGNNVYELKLA